MSLCRILFVYKKMRAILKQARRTCARCWHNLCVRVGQVKVHTDTHEHSHRRCIHVYMYTKTWHMHIERVKHVDECETEIETESSRSSRDISEMANTTSNNKRHKKTENNESSSVSRRQRQPHSDKKEEIFRICSNMLLYFVLCVLYLFLYCTWKLLHISNSESYRSFIIRYARYALLFNI